ncbi:MAG TPA: hypothetical protein H9671_08055 [Firmicutes bacterium]|nr:hypothetical protein [Bacillota bacterium]
MLKFFKNAFEDMKESARAQHEIDKANFEAVRAASKANFQAAKTRTAHNISGQTTVPVHLEVTIKES